MTRAMACSSPIEPMDSMVIMVATAAVEDCMMIVKTMPMITRMSRPKRSLPENAAKFK